VAKENIATKAQKHEIALKKDNKKDGLTLIE